MHCFFIRNLLVLVLLLSAAGCLEHRRKHSLVRAWADYNSLNQPALFFEQIHHQPYRPARVDYFRWMYNEPPGTLGGQQPIAYDPPAVDAADETQALPGPTSEPTVPPPETLELEPAVPETLDLEPVVPDNTTEPPTPDPIHGAEHSADGVPANASSASHPAAGGSPERAAAN